MFQGSAVARGCGFYIKFASWCTKLCYNGVRAIVVVTKARKLSSLDELKAMFDPSVHSALEQLARNARWVVVYENLDFWSSRFGERSALRVGPGCTVESLEKALSIYLGDLPSERQYPVAYWEKEENGSGDKANGHHN